MKLRAKYLVLVLAAALCAVPGLFSQAPAGASSPAQAPAAGQATPVPAQQLPKGIQTLPIPTGKDTVKPSDVVLTIGSEKLTREQYEDMKAGLPQQYQGAAAQMGDKGFATNYGQFRGLSMLGERDKLDQTPEFQSQLKFLRTELLARLAIEHLNQASQNVSDADIKTYYAAHQAEMVQAKVKGILVSLNPAQKPATAPAGTPGGGPAAAKSRTDEEAKARADELRKQIVGGADFATVAKANSDHQGSAEKGGDFGTIRKSMLPANLDKIVFSLKPKEVSEPVKEGTGYYIFQVDEIKPVTMDEATATIRNKISQERMNASIETVKKEFPVVLNEAYFTDQQPAAGQRPVITGVAPAKPSTPAPAPKPAEKKPQ